MKANVGAFRHRVSAFRALLLCMLTCVGVSLSGVVQAQPSQAPAPTVGEIVVDRFDCDSRQLWFHVPVANLPLSPSLETLGYSVQGPDALSPVANYLPNVELASYTGNVHLRSRAPVTDLDPSEANIPLEIAVYVGYGDATGQTDSSSATYITNCRDTEAPSDEIVQELVALLIAILTSLLGDGGAE